MIELLDVYNQDTRYRVLKMLYIWLEQRTPDQSISHKQMPTSHEHIAFVGSKPYPLWFMIKSGNFYVGNIYLTAQREVGIHIDNDHRGKGYGSAALKALREISPGPLLANINPANSASIEFFKKHGATLLQHTYKL